jgi:hypothetical protein
VPGLRKLEFRSELRTVFSAVEPRIHSNGKLRQFKVTSINGIFLSLQDAVPCFASRSKIALPG